MSEFDSTDIELALRARCEALVVATTPVTSLSATAVGFKRTTGSFLDDAENFFVGMEVVPLSGWDDTTPHVIMDITAKELITLTKPPVTSAKANRVLRVGFPVDRVYDNNTKYKANPARHYVECDFEETPSQMISATSDGVREDRGLFSFRWYGTPDTGALGLRKCVVALGALFKPGTSFQANGHAVYVPMIDSLTKGARIQQRGQHAMLPGSIPWRAYVYQTTSTS